MNNEKLRKEYTLSHLEEHTTSDNPFEQFALWFNEVLQSNNPEPYAMTLSTINASGKPSSRVVLLRHYDENGFVFYTNYQSQKGIDIEHFPHVALNFFWPEFERQVRIEGIVYRVATAVSDAYFASRPRESQLGAWASPQSNEIGSRTELEQAFAACNEKFEGQEVPRPANWGGYIINPEKFEFWQGRPGRLHDRLCFQLSENGQWRRFRKAP
ncbi:MAG: pyridoxamine 5'-phosphate oxidase [Bacteroidia bacterium]|jgi:pyridoxamine 5'-phosphate oxidase